MLVDIGLQCCRGSGALADIELQHARLPTQGGNGLRQVVGFFAAAAAMYHNIVTVTREPKSDGFADAPARAGYQTLLFIRTPFEKLIGIGGLKNRERGAGHLLVPVVDVAVERATPLSLCKHAPDMNLITLPKLNIGRMHS